MPTNRRRRALPVVLLCCTVAVVSRIGSIASAVLGVWDEELVDPVDRQFLRAAPLVQTARAVAAASGYVNLKDANGVRTTLMSIQAAMPSFLPEPAPVRGAELPVGPEQFSQLHSLATLACRRLRIACPSFFVAPGDVPHAWQKDGEVFITEPMLKILNDNEMLAVIGLQLGHIRLQHDRIHGGYAEMAAHAKSWQWEQLEDIMDSWKKISMLQLELDEQAAMREETPWYRRWITTTDTDKRYEEALHEIKNKVSSKIAPIIGAQALDALVDVGLRARLFSADRAAVVACGDLETALRTLCKLEGSADLSITRESALQLIALPAWQKAKEVWVGGPIPDLRVRIAQLLQWAETPAFSKVMHAGI